MDIYILRHGLAVERGAAGYANDADRPLTPKGERRLSRIVEAMQMLELSFDLILSSPYLRAKQTAEIVAEALKAKKRLELDESLVSEGDPKTLIENLNSRQPRCESIMLVGHEPYLSQLISVLVSGNNQTSVTLKKGGLCKVTT